MALLLIIPGAIVVFIAALLIRAARFAPFPADAGQSDVIAVDAGEAALRLAEMIRCKTVSYRDKSLEDPEEFEKFLRLLPQLYPNVHKACSLERMGETGVLYKLAGKSCEAPVVFMSHYDVVPADEGSWKKPAFGGLIEDGVLWGRGTLDTKATLCAIMETAENLIASGFEPENDLYFAFAGDEETGGPTAPFMVQELKKRGIAPAMVLDEGGAVMEGVFPGVGAPCALIGTAEKGMLITELTVESSGGHASMPPPHTPVGTLSRAVTRIEGKPGKTRLTPPVAAMFDTIGRHSSFIYKLVFANLWCLMPVLGAICRKRGGELNAMLRTTCAFTMMEGSKASNVIPPVAKMGANLRIIGGETPEGTIERMKAIVADPKVGFGIVYGVAPSPNSRTDGKHWEMVKRAAGQTWPDAIVSPYLMFACSDSRHYCEICDRVYRFSAAKLTREEFATIHGHNERIRVESLGEILSFYMRLMRMC